MRSASSSSYQAGGAFSALVLLAALIATGCGSNSSMPNSSVPKLSGNTSVTLLLTGTGNDQLSEMELEFQNLTLTSQSGKTVTVLSAQQPSEFVHLNGGLDFLATVTVPQDIYTAATATIGGAQFTCITLTSPNSPAGGGIDTSTYAYGYTPGPQVTVTLPSPVTITGNSMGLVLDLQMSQSAAYSSCYPSGTYSITPTFILSPFTFASQPANAGNGRMADLEGQIVSISAGGRGFTLSVPEGPFGRRTLSVTSNSATVFQLGVSSFSALSAGMFVNMDGGLQPDGSLLATRIAVEDTAAVNVLTGPLLEVTPEVSDLLVYGLLEQGPLISIGPDDSGLYAGTPYLNFRGATFQISGQLTNLQDLPFSAEFSASNMVPGQNVDITSPALAVNGPSYTPANTVTLIPQTIDGQVVSSSTDGGFAIYEVTLASYDLFPTLAVQPFQTTVENDPSVIEVYVDKSTQMLNTQPLAAGSTLRFYGLVFNDNGTLRMDCAQVNDGVDFSALPTASQQAHMEEGTVQQTQREGSNSLQQTISVIARKP